MKIHYFRFKRKKLSTNDKNFIFDDKDFSYLTKIHSKAFDNAGLIAFIVEDKSDIYYYKAVSSVEILMESKEELISTILSSNHSSCRICRYNTCYCIIWSL